MSAALRRRGMPLFGVALWMVVACQDANAPEGSGVVRDYPGVFKSSVPCPTGNPRPGGWCESEYWRLDTLINQIYTGTAACASMQSILRSYLQSGQIIRHSFASSSHYGQWHGDTLAEWNNGQRTDSIWLRSVDPQTFPADWGSVLRHEYSHGYLNLFDVDTAMHPGASSYQFCVNASSPTLSPTPSGPTVAITSLPDTMSLSGSGFAAQSNCTGNANVVQSLG
jgi:hypothetical protein